MSYIVDKLYLGDLADARDSVSLRDELGITHILTLSHLPLKREYCEGFTCKYVHVFDEFEADLLTHLEECNAFIAEARNLGGVLVHCMAGVSRSGTVVLAYIMKTLRLNLKQALKLVRKARAQVRPNPGFMHQLELYEKMGNKVDASSMDFKTYKLELLALHMQRGRHDGTGSLPDDALEADPSQSNPVGETIYKCRKCRRILLRDSSIMPHNEGCGSETFQQPWISHTRDDHVTCKQSIFIEPVEWMRKEILQIEGKLMCPKCNAKLGSFNWCGEHCPCGEFVCPAFHIANAKVDKCLPQVLLPSKHSSQPVVTTTTTTDTESASAGTEG